MNATFRWVGETKNDTIKTGHPGEERIAGMAVNNSTSPGGLLVGQIGFAHLVGENEEIGAKGNHDAPQPKPRHVAENS
jgi:hypothetical protein